MDPLPLEQEFRILSIKSRLNQLNREELENFLTDSLLLLIKLTHQTKQLKNELEGKNQNNPNTKDV
jgi:hypothetical protein